MQFDNNLYTELYYYTLGHEDPAFIHQNIVDAYSAQKADNYTKAIKITFALVGLYLHIEKGFTGKQVQRMHMYMASKNKKWPQFDLPKDRGTITVGEVMGAKIGKDRDEMIRKWCVSVWGAYKDNHKEVAEFVAPYLE